VFFRTDEQHFDTKMYNCMVILLHVSASFGHLKEGNRQRRRKKSTSLKTAGERGRNTSEVRYMILCCLYRTVVHLLKETLPNYYSDQQMQNIHIYTCIYIYIYIYMYYKYMVSTAICFSSSSSSSASLILLLC